MKITRKLTLPGRRESEFSSWEIEITQADIPAHMLPDQPSLQDFLQIMVLGAQARVLACHVADGTITNDEMTERLKAFVGPTPDWLNDIYKFPKPETNPNDPQP